MKYKLLHQLMQPATETIISYDKKISLYMEDSYKKNILHKADAFRKVFHSKRNFVGCL